MTMILVSKEGESVKCSLSLKTLSKTISYMTENISDEKLSSGDEVIPLPLFSLKTINQMLNFCNIIEFKHSFLLKTKPILQTTLKDDLFFEPKVLEYFTALSFGEFLTLLELSNYLNFAVLQDACMGYMAFTLY